MGLGEVGRGSLAGPIVVGCVFLSKEISVPEQIVIRDSKQMTKKQRETTSDWLKKHVIYSLGMSSSEIIDRYGIIKALVLAAQQARNNISLKIPSIVKNMQIFVDGNQHWFEDDIPIIKGDQEVSVISMASIIAKVYRDHLVAKYDHKYPNWQFVNHVGYGTKHHRQMIRENGLIPGLHRKTFCQKILSQAKNKKKYITKDD